MHSTGFEAVDFIGLPFGLRRRRARASAQRKDTTVRLNVQTRINITRWAEEYISGLVENHNGDSEDVRLIIHDLDCQATSIDRTKCRSSVAELYPTWIHSHPAQNGSP